MKRAHDLVSHKASEAVQRACCPSNVISCLPFMHVACSCMSCSCPSCPQRPKLQGFSLQHGLEAALAMVASGGQCRESQFARIFLADACGFSRRLLAAAACHGGAEGQSPQIKLPA